MKQGVQNADDDLDSFRSFELAGVRIGHIARRQNEKGQNYLEVHVTPRKACSDSEDDGLRSEFNRPLRSIDAQDSED